MLVCDILHSAIFRQAMLVFCWAINVVCLVMTSIVISYFNDNLDVIQDAVDDWKQSPIVDITLVKNGTSCPPLYKPMKVETWPGTSVKCSRWEQRCHWEEVCTTSSSSSSSSSSSPTKSCHQEQRCIDVCVEYYPLYSSRDMYLWKRTKICIRRAGPGAMDRPLINGGNCPTGYAVCPGTDICWPMDLILAQLCPITDIRITGTFTANQSEYTTIPTEQGWTMSVSRFKSQYSTPSRPMPQLTATEKDFCIGYATFATKNGARTDIYPNYIDFRACDRRDTRYIAVDTSNEYDVFADNGIPNHYNGYFGQQIPWTLGQRPELYWDPKCPVARKNVADPMNDLYTIRNLNIAAVTGYSLLFILIILTFVFDICGEDSLSMVFDIVTNVIAFSFGTCAIAATVLAYQRRWDYHYIVSGDCGDSIVNGALTTIDDVVFGISRYDVAMAALGGFMDIVFMVMSFRSCCQNDEASCTSPSKRFQDSHVEMDPNYAA